jgi:hypothetical protein
MFSFDRDAISTRRGTSQVARENIVAGLTGDTSALGDRFFAFAGGRGRRSGENQREAGDEKGRWRGYAAASFSNWNQDVMHRISSRRIRSRYWMQLCDLTVKLFSIQTL